MKGKFITFEGSEGSGKSTQIRLIRGYLNRKKKNVLFIREPGGVNISEKIRKILLDLKNKEMCHEAETMLYMAARAQLTAEIIEPALKVGKIVLCDRFLDSTIVYQGYGSGISVPFIKNVGAFATRNIRPDLTFIFDIDAKKGLSRIKGTKDRIESRALTFHNKVRSGYNKLAKAEPRRVKLIQGQQPKEVIHEIVKGHVDRLLRTKSC